MHLKRIPIGWRIAGLLAGAASVWIARYLLSLSRSGIEDVPPPFILLPGLAGIALLAIGLLGRVPWQGRRAAG